MRENELLSEDLEWSTPSDDAIGEFVVRSYILIDGIVYMRISDYCAKTDAYYCSPALLGDDGNYFVSGPLNTHWRKIKIGPAEDYGQLFNYRIRQVMRDAYPEEQAASLAASRVDGGRGVITVGRDQLLRALATETS
jgi:hypothetical protein